MVFPRLSGPPPPPSSASAPLPPLHRKRRGMFRTRWCSLQNGGGCLPLPRFSSFFFPSSFFFFFFCFPVYSFLSMRKSFDAQSLWICVREIQTEKSKTYQRHTSKILICMYLLRSLFFQQYSNILPVFFVLKFINKFCLFFF